MSRSMAQHQLFKPTIIFFTHRFFILTMFFFHSQCDVDPTRPSYLDTEKYMLAEKILLKNVYDKDFFERSAFIQILIKGI